MKEKEQIQWDSTHNRKAYVVHLYSVTDQLGWLVQETQKLSRFKLQIISGLVKHAIHKCVLLPDWNMQLRQKLHGFAMKTINKIRSLAHIKPCYTLFSKLPHFLRLLQVRGECQGQAGETQKGVFPECFSGGWETLGDTLSSSLQDTYATGLVNYFWLRWCCLLKSLGEETWYKDFKCTRKMEN